ncbi:hypothetical protein E2C01_049438 [Portunus trituberculatus]|uniref:Secreted protein n=1 Tax=Portunus trituberculatus TaxID=210409 RepID=A0A5B7G5J0_PORTR|nr:hypothetical protein [Portunus trituberculatus]
MKGTNVIGLDSASRQTPASFPAILLDLFFLHFVLCSWHSGARASNSEMWYELPLVPNTTLACHCLTDEKFSHLFRCGL